MGKKLKLKQSKMGTVIENSVASTNNSIEMIERKGSNGVNGNAERMSDSEESDSDISSVSTASEDNTSPAMVMEPKIQISGFIFRYRDHSVRMSLNKIK